MRFWRRTAWQRQRSVLSPSYPAPLLFILPGIGSNGYSGLGAYFAELFHKQGFHIVVMPSPMSWSFGLAASRSGAPGFAPNDARDLYDAMQRTLAVLATCYKVEPTRIALMGASLGGLEGAYLSLIDTDEQKIGIDTHPLVNPPLDLHYALKKVDEWNARSAKFGRAASLELVDRALRIVDAFSTEDRSDPAVFARFAAEFAKFTSEEIQFLLAKALQLSLPELVYVTQVIQLRNACAIVNSTLTCDHAAALQRSLGQHRAQDTVDADAGMQEASAGVTHFVVGTRGSSESGRQWYSIRYPRPAGSSKTLLGSSARYSFTSDSQSALVLVPGWTRHSRASFASGLSAGMKRRQSTQAF